MKNNNVYIMSMEGAEIFSHMFRERNINGDYAGMIPFSLELIKLRAEGFKTTTVKTNSEKEISDDIINVKFKHKVQNGNVVLEKKKETLDKMIESQNKLNENILYEKDAKKVIKINIRLEKLAQAIERMKESIKTIQEEIISNEKPVIFSEGEKEYYKWGEVKNDTLREYLYTNGFIITSTNEKTGNKTETKYVAYKRSSSKSRTGQVLFIKEKLYKKMINWSRMNLKFPKTWDEDFAGLLAYESLVGSALEDVININVNNILIVDDVESNFEQLCNVVRPKEEKGNLSSFEENAQVSNSLFDGESLLESSYFKSGQAMMLLRNHMFKSAAFNCNIQEFLKANCPDDVDFDNWKIKNMFEQEIDAKDIYMICTPTSLKALKFSSVVGKKVDMWNYWKELVQNEGNLFGICKHEKKSKRGTDFEGNVVQQTSYQMINSIDFSKDDINTLTEFEREYINKLKNDDATFIDYVSKNISSVNSHEMLIELAKHNKNFMNTAMFRGFRTEEIHKYVKHVKKGKIRLNGDYCVLLGNPMEYLYHAIGKLNVNDPEIKALEDNQIYTKLFEDNKKLVCFRNPHTSQSNVLVAKNTYKDDIDTYFNLTNNIVCVNAIKFAIQDILSSADYDSDTVVIFSNDKLLEVAEKMQGKYNVCINAVESEKKKYTINRENMAKIDNQLSTSQRNIGEVVNTGQQVMSEYWNTLANKSEVDEDLMKKVDVATVLSCICIDLAKKMYDVDIESEIKTLNKGLNKTKPKFFKFISQSKTIKNRVKAYNCPMDYLQDVMNLPNADPTKDIDMSNLLVKRDVNKGDRKQEDKIIDYVENMCEKLNAINTAYKNTQDEDEQEEKNNKLDSIIKYYSFYIQKLTVKEDTMYAILEHMNKSHGKIATKLMNVLYITQKDVFVNAFK